MKGNIMRYRSCVTAVLAAAFLSAGPTWAQQSDAADWSEYGNSRYEYTVCYPADLLKPQPESANGDGRVFTGKNGATMRVWGAGDGVGEWTVTKAKNWRTGQLAKDGVALSYMRQGKNFFALSGMRKGNIIYHKGILQNDQWRSVEFSYKAADRKIWDPVVERVASCLNTM